MNKLIIFGAGGHTKQCIEIAEILGYVNIKIFDDFKIGYLLGYEIINEINECVDFFIGIGDNKVRKIIYEKYKNNEYLTFINLIHPKSNLSKYSKIGIGNYIGCFANILQDTIIGNFNIINDSSTISHDCTINNFNHVSMYSFMAGNSHIGSGNFLCGHSMILPCKKLGNNNILGANSTLLKSFDNDNILIETPARIKNY